MMEEKIKELIGGILHYVTVDKIEKAKLLLETLRELVKLSEK